LDVRPAGRDRILSPAWDEPGWLDRATEWIDRHVERTDAVELVLARAWSAVARVPTADGIAWFKEDPPTLAFEPALTELLARRRPDRLPETIAIEGPRLLTRDAGSRLRAHLDDRGTAPSWPELLALQAELQIEFADDAAAALDLGTPDARPQVLPRLATELPGGSRRLDGVLRALDGLGDAIPASVVHTEAHDGNLFIHDGHVRLLDWAEAVVSHPFVGIVLPLRFAVERSGMPAERLRDAYLEPFTRFAPMTELRDAFAHGYLLGAFVRALTWHWLGADDPDDPVGAWLEIFDGVGDGIITLGEA
jgi:hypothetical protein